MGKEWIERHGERRWESEERDREKEGQGQDRERDEREYRRRRRGMREEMRRGRKWG